MQGSGKLADMETFAVVGATIADNFGVEMPEGTIGLLRRSTPRNDYSMEYQCC